MSGTCTLESEAVSHECTYAWEPWPIWREQDRPTFFPAAVTLTLATYVHASSGAECIGSELVRRWIPDGSRSMTYWPEEPGTGTDHAPTLVFSDGSSWPGVRVAANIPGIDNVEKQVGSAVLGRDGHITRECIPSSADGLDVVVRAALEAAADVGSDRSESTFREGAVIALPGPPIPDDVSDDMELRSWHAARRGEQLRALEIPPIRELQNDELRSRWAALYRPTVHASDPAGVIMWHEGAVRIWTPDRHPLLDPPVPRHELSPAARLLTEHFETEAH